FLFLITGAPSILNPVVCYVTCECLLTLNRAERVVDDHVDLPERDRRSRAIRINKIGYLDLALHADGRLAVIGIPLNPVDTPPVICGSDDSVFARRGVDILFAGNKDCTGDGGVADVSDRLPLEAFQV